MKTPNSHPFAQKSKGESFANRSELFSSFDWSDYKAQLQNRVRGSELGRYFDLTESEKVGIENTIRLNVSATPYYISLTDPEDPEDPIRKMIVPREAESVFLRKNPPILCMRNDCLRSKD